MSPNEPVPTPTEQEIDAILAGGDVARVEASTSVVTPTLLVGLGGTGAGVLRRVKQRLARLGVDDTFRFLVIDMDDRTRRAAGMLPGFGTHEYLFLDRRDARHVIARPDEHKGLADRLDLQDEDVLSRLAAAADNENPGAGQVRPVGMLGLHVCWTDLSAKVRGAVTALTERWAALKARLRSAAGTQRQISDRVDVVVVASTCGGTGSSLLLDMGVLLRDALGSALGRMSAYVTMPDVHVGRVAGRIGERENLQTNAYATLRELDFFLTGTAAARKVTISRLEGPPIPAPGSLFRPFYLVERVDSRSRDLGSDDAVFDTVALAITADVATAAGDSLRSGDANNRALNGLVDCPRTSRRRLYSTLGASALRFPLAQAVRYCAYRQAFEFAVEALAGAPQGDAAQASTAVKESDAWLAAAQIEERTAYKSDQVLDRLEGAVRPNVLVDRLYADAEAKTFHLDKRFHELLTASEGDWSGSERGLPRVAALATAAAAKMAEKAVESLRGKLSDVASRRGIAFARDFARQVELTCRATAEELRAEAGKLAQETPELRREEVALVKSLRGLRRRQTQTQGEIIDKVRTRRGREVGGAYRRAASSLHATVADAAGKLLGRLDRLSAACEALKTSFQTKMVESQPRPQVISDEVLAEVDVTTPDLMERIFAQHRMPSGGLAPRLLEVLEAEESRREPSPTAVAATVRLAVLRETAGHFLASFRQLNLARVVEDALGAGGTLKEQVAARFEEALVACRAQWRADIGVAGATFSDSLVIGWPAGVSPEATALTADVLRRAQEVLAQDARTGVEPEVVQTADPHRIFAVRRVHGGLPFYLRAWPEYATAYWEALEESRLPMHVFRRRLVDEMPALDTAESGAASGERLFAIALAMGWVAGRGSYYYFNLDEASDGDTFVVPVLSKWEGVVYTPKGELRADLGPLAKAIGGERPLFTYLGRKSAEKDRSLGREGGGLDVARRAFFTDPRLGRLVDRAWQRLRDRVGKSDLGAALAPYVTLLETKYEPGDDLYEEIEAQLGQLKREVNALREVKSS